MHYIGTYYKDDNIHVYLEYLDGNHLVHLNISKWSPSIVRKLRKGFQELLDKERDAGIDMIFTTGIGDNKIKLFNMIKPCFRIDPVPDTDPVIWVGCWNTEE